MHTFWRESLEKIYDNFLHDLKVMNGYCDLCGVSFNQGSLPDYSSGPQQNLYLLRYFSAYFFEYYEAFSELSRANFLDALPRIASIGCGSGIDGAAARFVFDDYAYRGIDRVRWNTWLAEEPPCIGDAIGFIPISENVFVFPKSLGELPPHVVSALAHNLPRTNAAKVCIINSRRGTDTKDEEACGHILQGFGQLLPEKLTIGHLGPRNDGKTGLGQYHWWFTYPGHIIDTITQLSNNCPARTTCPRWQCTDGACPRYGVNKPCWEKNIPMQRRPVTSDTNFCTDIYLIDRT